MDIIIQGVIDSIVNDVRRCIEEEKEEVGYINWSVHLEEVRSFRQYRRKDLEIEGSPLKFR